MQVCIVWVPFVIKDYTVSYLCVAYILGIYTLRGNDEVRQADGTLSWELLVWSGVAMGPYNGSIQITCPLILNALAIATTYTGDPLMTHPLPTTLNSRWVVRFGVKTRACCSNPHFCKSFVSKVHGRLAAH